MSAESVYQQLVESTRHYADRPFLHIPAVALSTAETVVDSNFDATYAQILAECDRLKEIYSNTGLGQGDRVAILLENRPEFFCHWFALNGLGVSVVPVNSGLTINEVAYLLEHSDVRLAVSLQSGVKLLESAISTAALSIAVVVDTQVESIELSASPRSQNAALNRDTECAILYTSGSTGKPKGCLLSNDYFLSSGAWYRDATDYCTLEKGAERLITPLPVVHMNAMACSTMGMMMSGGCVIQLDRFHPRSWWATVRESRATIIHYLGVMPAILLNSPPEEQDDFSAQIKFGFGAGVNPVHHDVFEQRFGFPLIESWGMTETGCSNCITAIREPRHVGTSCIGTLPERLEIKLVDESGVAVKDGDPGELWVRTKGDNPRLGFFSGYYKNQAATDESWLDGWFHTGDILRQGDGGALHFVDRLKNVIRRSGENISALEVEATLSLDPNIQHVGVTAVPDEIRGDEVCACVIAKPGVIPDEETAKQIFSSAALWLSYYKLPGYLVFVDALPLTASNKPQRAELKKRAREWVANHESNEQCIDMRGLKRK